MSINSRCIVCNKHQLQLFNISLGNLWLIYVELLYRSVTYPASVIIILLLSLSLSSSVVCTYNTYCIEHQINTCSAASQLTYMSLQSILHVLSNFAFPPTQSRKIHRNSLRKSSRLLFYHLSEIIASPFGNASAETINETSYTKLDSNKKAGVPSTNSSTHPANKYIDKCWCSPEPRTASSTLPQLISRPTPSSSSHRRPQHTRSKPMYFVLFQQQLLSLLSRHGAHC